MTPYASRTYTDNCNVTVKGGRSGRTKRLRIGRGQNYVDQHDVDNRYTWSTGAPWNPDGTGFTDFLAKLNTPPCFAGHCDWRLLPPESARNSCHSGSPSYSCASCSAHELETILLAPSPRGTHPCIDPIFGPTAATSYSHSYWSATTVATYPDYAWNVGFWDGFAGYSNKVKNFPVRAVRGGP